MLSERLGRLALLAHGHRLQPDLLRPALPRHHGDAAARLHLSGPARLGRAQPGLDDRRVRHGGVGPRLPLRTSCGACGAAKIAGDNPWDAWTLEWATTSPPPHAQLRARAAGPRPATRWRARRPRRRSRGRVRRPVPRTRDPSRRSASWPSSPPRRASSSSSSSRTSSSTRARAAAAPRVPRRQDDGRVHRLPLREQLHLALRREGARGRRSPRVRRRWLVATIVLGASSWSGQAHGVSPLFSRAAHASNASLFASTFFTLPAFTASTSRSASSRLGVGARASPATSERANRAVVRSHGSAWLYWHFVDVVWIVVFSVVYLRAVL